MEYRTGNSVQTITVVDPGTGFTARPTITIAGTGDALGVNATATAEATVVSGELALAGNSAQCNTGNASYVAGANVTISGGANVAGSQAVFHINSTAVGVVKVISSGNTYVNNQTIILANNGTSTSNAVFTVTTDTNGNVASLSITSGGAYSVNPRLGNSTVGVATTAGGSNATVAGVGCTVDITMFLANVHLTDGGRYTTLPTLTANPVTSAQANGAKITVACGLGSTVTMTQQGEGYTSRPDLTIGGTGGSGANAVANMADLGGYDLTTTVVYSGNTTVTTSRKIHGVKTVKMKVWGEA